MATARENSLSTLASEELPIYSLPRSAIGWLTLFGPGAIVASMTIGTGELIFSTRGGALFGYNILFVFVMISLLKWGLVLASSRHIVLTGVHPYQRMFDLPGPRGWFPLMCFLILAICMPIWVSFLSAVTGNLMAWVTGTSGNLEGGIDYLWGAVILAAALVLTGTGGYSQLERIQKAIVAALIFCAGVTLIIYQPDWMALLKGAFIPHLFAYPTWLNEAYPRIADQSVWVETTRYVGVIGGGAFDYLVYTSFLREKAWGASAAGPISNEQLAVIASDPAHPVRKWLRAPFIDCSISFVLIVAFSAVFVACGSMFLGPAHKVPDEKNFLDLQAQFMTRIHPWLLPLYVTGAFLTMFGTVYASLEVAYTITSEMARAASREFVERHEQRIRKITIGWCGIGGFVILFWLFVYLLAGGENKPRLLLAILTPANLFTGVLMCGVFCFLNLWMDKKYLPRPLRMPVWLMLLNLVSFFVFLVLGVKGYWEHESREYALWSLPVMLGIGVVGAALANFILTRPKTTGRR